VRETTIRPCETDRRERPPLSPTWPSTSVASQLEPVHTAARRLDTATNHSFSNFSRTSSRSCVLKYLEVRRAKRELCGKTALFASTHLCVAHDALENSAVPLPPPPSCSHTCVGRCSLTSLSLLPHPGIAVFCSSGHLVNWRITDVSCDGGKDHDASAQADVICVKPVSPGENVSSCMRSAIKCERLRTANSTKHYSGIKVALPSSILGTIYFLFARGAVRNVHITHNPIVLLHLRTRLTLPRLVTATLLITCHESMQQQCCTLSFPGSIQTVRVQQG